MIVQFKLGFYGHVSADKDSLYSYKLSNLQAFVT